MQQTASKDFMKTLFSYDFCFQGMKGGDCGVSALVLQFLPWQKLTLMALSTTCGPQVQVFPEAGVTPVPEHWPPWKAQEMKKETFTWKTSSIPCQGPAGCIYILPWTGKGNSTGKTQHLGVSGIGVILGKGSDGLKKKKKKVLLPYWKPF